VKGPFTLDTLARQARGSDGLHGAVGDHFQPGRAMTTGEAQAIAAFQAQLHTRVDLFQAANAGTISQQTLPPCNPNVPATCRGREFFIDQPIAVADMGHRGLCAACHSGPGLNTTNQFNPATPPLQPESDGTCPCLAGHTQPAFFGPPITAHQLADGTCPNNLLPTIKRTIQTSEGPTDLCFHRVTNNIVAELNTAALPEFIFSGVDPVWGPIQFRSPDLGHILQSGNLCEIALSCFLLPSSEPGVNFQTQSQFRIQSLWGSSRRQRFFHDNSARSLQDVLKHEQKFFHETALGLQAIGDPNALAFEISEQDAVDIIAFIRGIGL
jgi:hypothetical protein